MNETHFYIDQSHNEALVLCILNKNDEKDHNQQKAIILVNIKQ